MQARTTQSIIEEMLAAAYGAHPDERKEYLFLQALHGLVRLAKAEHMLEIRRNVDLASGGMATAWRRKEMTAVKRRIRPGCGARQGHLEFGNNNGDGE